MTEFVTTSRLADLFNVSTSKTYAVKQLSKHNVTVDLMQLKRSMYDDTNGFIFKHFDVLCNLLRNFEEYDEGLRMSALKVLLQVSEKCVSSLTTFLEEEEFDHDDLFKKRNAVKMEVFLLCHFANAFDSNLRKKSMAANVGKGRKKKVAVDSEWPDHRVKFIVVIKKLFKLPIYKLWDPPTVDPEFVNFVTVTFFKLLENVDVARDKGMKTEIFRFLGTVLKEYRTGMGYSVKIIQLVQDFDHLSSILAEGVIYFVKECCADTLISDTVKEAALLDVDALEQNRTAAKSLSEFLVSTAEECPQKFVPVVSLILQFLEWDSYNMRSCALSILGVLLSKTLCSENLSQKEQEMREELLEHVVAHLKDANSFVRCRSIQVLKMLMEEKAVASFELVKIGEAISMRLDDKASNVRKNAMSFLAEFVHVNQFACQVPFPVLKESYKKELKKLVCLKKGERYIEEDLPDKVDKPNAIIFDDSDDELDNGKENGNEEKNGGIASPKSSENKSNENGKKDNDEIEDDVVNEVQECNQEGDNDVQNQDTDETLKAQQRLVDYLRNTVNFAQVIYSMIKPIHTLLHLPTQTDVLEAIEFIVAVANNSITGSDALIKEVLKLVWSKEGVIREAAFNAFKALYLSSDQNKCSPSDISKSLIDLLKDASVDDIVNIEEFVKHFSQLEEIPRSVSKVLWATFASTDKGVTEENKISILQLLGMLNLTQPDAVLGRIDDFVELCLGKLAEDSFLLAMYAFRTLGKINQKTRGKVDSSLQEEIRLPHSHLLVSRVKYFLIDGIKNYDDDQWISMANEAVFTIISLIDEPVLLCAEIAIKLSSLLYDEMKVEKIDTANIDETALQSVSPILLSRFTAFCGHVAIHYNTYLKVYYFGYLRRQEALREERRRRASMHAQEFQSTSFISPTRKSGKRKKSFHQKYKMIPPVDEETTNEQIIEKCANDVQNPETLVGSLLPFVITTCRWTLKVYNEKVQAAASLSLTKFMLLSEQVCNENMQLFATIAEKSPGPYIRANMMVAIGDLTTSYPNIVEPWTQQIFQRLNDSDSLVRENAIIILTHLLLHDFVRIKALISDAAKCIADSNPKISSVAKHLFAELSKKGNVIYNIIPDIISSLSDPESGVDEQTFQTVMKYMLQYIEKEKLVEGLVEKLCHRFMDSSSEVQMHELTFCLSILTLNDKCYSKLMEFKSLLKERMSDPVIMKYITNITANAKKDAKTAAELERFRNELGL